MVAGGEGRTGGGYPQTSMGCSHSGSTNHAFSLAETLMRKLPHTNAGLQSSSEHARGGHFKLAEAYRGASNPNPAMAYSKAAGHE